MTIKVKSNQIPEFTSGEEEAKWFDEHDLGDYLNEFKLVDRKEVRIAKQLSQNITVRLTPEFLVKLRREAEKKGVGPSTLARMWIVEYLHKSTGSQSGKA